jgi:hypothetical protein
MLLLVQQLPPADTQTAAGVLSRVYQQLQQAAAAAGLLQDTTAHIHTSTGSDHSTGAPIETATDPLARQLAGCRVDNSSSPAAPASQHQSTNPAVTSAYTQAAAAALVEAGVLPDACTPALQDVPADLLHTLQQLQDIHAQQQQRWQQYSKCCPAVAYSGGIKPARNNTKHSTSRGRVQNDWQVYRQMMQPAAC